MAYFSVLSDIHGYLDIFKEVLKNVDLETKGNKLILLGDYIDRGPQSCETLYFVKELTEKYPEQVIALRGNHEELFLDDLNADYPMGEMADIRRFLSDEEYAAILKRCNEGSQLLQAALAYQLMTKAIKNKHRELLTWLKSLPYYYETKTQIFVHAGIDEDAGEDWKWGTSDEELVWKNPPTLGKFYKDIIAGHTHTSTIAGDESYHRVFWDKKSHFFIDGATSISKVIPLLKYDTSTKRYSSFERVTDKNGTAVWVEYFINSR